MSEHQRVCEVEADKWLDCLEPMADNAKKVKTTESACATERDAFSTCVAEWRKPHKEFVVVKSTARGHPPQQCAPLGCLSEKCLFNTSYDSERCRVFMTNFKQCTLLLYGKEYVDY